MWVITVRRRYTGVTITGSAIIVIAAVAIDPAMDQPCPSHFISGYESRFSADPATILARLLETS